MCYGCGVGRANDCARVYFDITNVFAVRAYQGKYCSTDMQHMRANPSTTLMAWRLCTFV